MTAVGDREKSELPNRAAPNPWGFLAMVAAAFAFGFGLLRLNSTLIFETLVRPNSEYAAAIGIPIVQRLIYLPFILGISGIVLAKGRSYAQCIVGILLGACSVAGLYGIKCAHFARLNTFTHITNVIEQYSNDHGNYPPELGALTGLTENEQRLVTFIPGASRGEHVSWVVNWPVKREFPRMVCYLNDITLGEHFVYLTDGHITSIPTEAEFQHLVTASLPPLHD